MLEHAPMHTHVHPADLLRSDSGMQGVLLDGERYDIGGDPMSYLDTLQALSPQKKSAESSPLNLG